MTVAKVDRKPFEGDLQDGQAYEFLVARAIGLHLHAAVEFLDGYGSDLRLYVPEDVEVKYDWEARRTGNIYLELENTKQNIPSGIALTNATYWAQCVPHLGKIYFFQVVEMRKFLSFHQDFGTRHGGDDNSFGLIIPIADLEKIPFIKSIPLKLLE